MSPKSSSRTPEAAPEVAAGRWRAAAVVILLLTVGQLAIATFVPLDRFAGKAFGARLVAYPVMMLLPGWCGPWSVVGAALARTQARVPRRGRCPGTGSR